MRRIVVTALSNSAEALAAQGKVSALRLLDGVLGVPKPVASGVPDVTGAGSGSAPSAAPVAAGGRVAFEPLAAAVMHVESRGNAAAVSPKGARGQMQTMPGTLRDPGFGIRPAANDSPEELTRVGRDYLKAMLSRYNGDLVLALSAYNAGPARADKWQKQWAGKSQAQKMALVPIAETKDYVGQVLRRVGLGGDASESAAVSADPTFRLTNPNADPVTAYEQSGEVSALAGIEQLNLSGEDTARLRDIRNQVAARLRAAHRQKTDEDQERNASSMALRLWGQGPLLSTEEIREGIRSGAIAPQQGLSLYSMQQSVHDRGQAQADRAEAQADREADERRKEQASRISGRYISRILSGKTSGAQARAELLQELPAIRDPIVQASVANTVLGTSADIEQLVANSAPVRALLRQFDDRRAAWTDKLGGRSSTRKALPAAYGLLDQAQAEFVARVRDGEDPDAANKAVALKFVPRLNALVPPPRR